MGGRSWRLGIAAGSFSLAAILVALGSVTSPAQALRGTQSSGRTTKLGKPLPAPDGFKLQSSNGYSIAVIGALPRNGQRAVILMLVSGGQGQALYTAKATVTERSIEANLGRLGHIAVTFQPSGRATRERSSCEKKRVAFDSGSYVGTIDFHGEQGYTSVEATRAKGNIELLLNLVCPARDSSGTGPGLPGAELIVKPDQSRFGPSLSVVENDPTAPVKIGVNVNEEREGIEIWRATNTTSSSSAFSYDDRIQTATVSPPPPFSGEAVFSRTHRPGNSWQGNLAVDLPGRSNVPLTGEGLSANLIRARQTGSEPVGAFALKVDALGLPR
jgi:hypothetical protein